MKSRTIAAAALSIAMLVSVAACGGSDDTAGDGKVTLDFWHISTTTSGKAYQENIAKEFEKTHPNVTVNVQAIQTEDYDGKLQTAMQDANSAPDVFLSRGGQKLTDMVEAGQVMDLTGRLSDDTQSQLEDVLEVQQVDGKQYGVPVMLSPGGFFYSKDLFAQAGIESTPTTMDEFNDAVTKLKDAGVTPIALGGKDAWPAAHYWYWFALRECSTSTFQDALKSKNFTDSCWVKAGQNLQDLADTEPFNDGFLTTSAAQGANSSAGLLANHKAAMELMGSWEPMNMTDLAPNGKMEDLGYFAFPEVDGGKGDQTAMMGGSDGYSCSVNAPEECVEFLEFMVTKENQEKYYESFQSIPANKEARSAVDNEALKDVLTAYSKASSMSLWLDTQFGSNVGNALNTGVVNMLSGSGSPKDIVQITNDAAAKG